MKILIVGSGVSVSKSRFASIVEEWAKDREIDVIVVNAEDAESLNGLTADLAIVDELIPNHCFRWAEPLIISKKGPNKPYYRSKERW